MPRVSFQELLDAGAHFGHLKRKWNPNMEPYIFMEKNGIHIIDLQKTIVKIDEAASAAKQIAKSGRKILFVATKKQAKELVSDLVKKIDMPYVTERWPGGMLTNFPTIRKAVKKMVSIDRMAKEPSWENLSKREKLQITRQRVKLERVLGSIADMARLPAALFIVDVVKEKIAVHEAQRLGIPIFAIVDTNSNPEGIDFVIPANDDASQSINLIVGAITEAISEGLNERKAEKKDEAESSAPRKKSRRKPRRERRSEQESPEKKKAAEKVAEDEEADEKLKVQKTDNDDIEDDDIEKEDEVEGSDIEDEDEVEDSDIEDEVEDEDIEDEDK